jgi:hypothetical protein
MFGLSAVGPLVKARESARVFVRHVPSLRDLWESRTGSFDRAHAILPSNARVGEPVTLTLQAWDEYERLHAVTDGFRLDATDPAARYPDRVEFPPDNGGVIRREGLAFGTPGVQYLTLVHEPTGERFVSNPVQVATDDPDRRVFWGDVHLHSVLSDGTGSMVKGMRFGRDVMDLDVVAYTDHDTMGFFIPPSLQRRRMHRRYFRRMQEVAAAFDDPGEFVTLLAYEWTKQPNRGGHVNVYFDDVAGAELFDSLDAETDTYERLFDRLAAFNADGGTQAVAVPHHPAESMYPFDFSATAYDDEVAPLVEVYSQWGSSERPAREGNDFPLEMGQGEIDRPGHYVQDALELGYRVGLTGSADYHGPHPGHSLIHARPHLPALSEWLEDGVGWANIWRMWDENSYPGGLQAFYAPDLTRESVFEAMRSRAVYATSQPHRILVDFAVGGVAVGENGSQVVLDAPDAAREVTVEVAGTAPVASVEVLKNNAVWRAVEGTTNPEASLSTYTVAATWTDDAPVTGMTWDEDRGTDADVYYLRVRQAGRSEETPGLAWAGPIWVEAGA